MIIIIKSANLHDNEAALLDDERVFAVQQLRRVAGSKSDSYNVVIAQITHSATQSRSVVPIESSLKGCAHSRKLCRPSTGRYSKLCASSKHSRSACNTISGMHMPGAKSNKSCFDEDM
jgi:hypothetical protein